MRKINHFGIPTQTPQVGETYAEGMKLHLTDWAKSPNKIEFLRFEQGSCMHELIQKVPHIAYEVPCIDTELKNAKSILLEKTKLSDTLSIAFIEEEGIPVELMCFS